MKRNISFILTLLSCLIILSCEKDDFNYPEGHVGRSKITNYVNIAPIGEPLLVITQGTAYTDEGATSTAGGKDVEYTTAGAVDPSTPGVYVITYSAVNEDGFPSSAYRTVAVVSPSVASNDFSGTYSRDLNGQLSVWTKTGVGTYTVTNPGGAAGADDLEVTVVNYSGNNIAIPRQVTDVGDFASANGVYDPVNGQYSWNVVNGGYGPALRTFIKQ